MNQNSIVQKQTNKLSQPVELGKVNWERNFEAGVAAAKKSEKPIFILFQEVPGCATCQNYGQQVLSHPLIVEAIESEFVPVAVFNNKGGEDKKVLSYFKEPSWNNPVVRIVDEDKKDVVRRVSGNYSKAGVVNAMIAALQKSQRQIPEYLHLLQKEFTARQNGLEEATVAMYCFWTGEKELAKIPGIIETQPGFMNGKEVVNISYDPSLINYEQVIARAKQSNCASHVFAENNYQFKQAKGVVGNAVSDKSNFRLDSEPKYYLAHTPYQFIPMTSLQATLVNSEIGQRSNPDYLLSPRQLELLKKGKKGESMVNVDIVEGWEW